MNAYRAFLRERKFGFAICVVLANRRSAPKRVSGFGFTGFVEFRREYDALPVNMNVDIYKAAPSTYRL